MDTTQILPEQFIKCSKATPMRLVAHCLKQITQLELAMKIKFTETNDLNQLAHIRTQATLRTLNV